MTDDAGGQLVEVDFRRADRLRRMVVPHAHGQGRRDFIGEAGLDDRDVLPAETRAVGGAEATGRGAGVADGVHFAVTDALDIEGPGQGRRGLVSEAHGVVGGDIETAALGEEAGILVERGHPQAGLVGRADLQLRGGLPGPTEPGATTDGAVVAGSRDAELLETRGLEALPREDRGDAESMPTVGAPGPGRRDEQLGHVHGSPGRRPRRGRLKKRDLIARVHPAVAKDGQTIGDTVGERGLIAEVRDIETTVGVTVEGRAIGRDAAIRSEPGQAELMAVRDLDQTRRVGRRGEGVLGESDARAAQALGLDAIAVVEIAVGGESDRGSEQERERDRVAHGKGFDS